MKFFSFALCGLKTIGKKSRRRSFLSGGCDYSSLEGRKLLASIGLEGGVLSIFGTDDAADRATVTSLNSGATVRAASLQDFPRKIFLARRFKKFFSSVVTGTTSSPITRLYPVALTAITVMTRLLAD